MLRNVLAVVLSFVVGNVVIMAVQAVNMMIFPAPPGFDFNDAEAVAAMVASMPLGAFMGVELSYVAASAGAGAVIARVAASRHVALGVGVGVLFTAANFMNMASIPHPMWFAVLTTVTFVPVTLAAVMGAARRPA
ncbi:hypothetical protein LBMAG42_16490 [Deltaproteobacteria bacterium]|nr:hypothetical protein LBMAG42_16490 [Deltaproteobacteria bacterium]